MQNPRMPLGRTETSHPVGTKASNAWGLHDMIGNVEEWCWDYMADYSGTAQTNPTGHTSGSKHVIRGGGYTGEQSWCGAKARDSGAPDRKWNYVGLRVERPFTP